MMLQELPCSLQVLTAAQTCKAAGTGTNPKDDKGGLGPGGSMEGGMEGEEAGMD